MRVCKTACGGKMVTAVLDDRTARIEMTIFDDVNEQHGHLLQKDKLLFVEGSVSWDDFNGSYHIRALPACCTKADEDPRKFIDTSIAYPLFSELIRGYSLSYLVLRTSWRRILNDPP